MRTVELPQFVLGESELITPTGARAGRKALLGRIPLPGAATRFARRHGLFGALLLVAVGVRVIVMLGYPGPLLYPDSVGYVLNTLTLAADQLRPAGYPIMLRLLDPLHSLAAVVAIQHAMGLTAGVLGYALLRRRFGLPGWGATVAMIPVLLSAYAMQIEHFLLADTLFAFLIMIALVVMMWRPDPPLWACGLAGLLLAAAVIVRTQGTPLLIVFVVCLLIRFAGWRTITSVIVICLAFALPVVGYAAWFDRSNDSFHLTTADGAFLYAEVTTFANCATIQPPADERFLCLNVPERLRAAYAPYYLWRRDALNAVPGGRTGNRADKIGVDFALRAIRAQPLDYLRAVGENFGETFVPHSGHPRAFTIAWAGTQSQLDYMFPAAVPIWPETSEDGLFVAYDGARQDTRVVPPYSGWIQAYQRYVVVSGPLLGMIALFGLGGLIISWRRRGGPALMPWLTGMALLATPAAVLFDVRYVVCAIPPLCVAAGIGGQQIGGRVRTFRTGRRRPAPRPGPVLVDQTSARLVLHPTGGRDADGPVPAEVVTGEIEAARPRPPLE